MVPVLMVDKGLLMRLLRTFGGVLVFGTLCATAVAESSRHFDAPPERVTLAVRNSIAANGKLVYEDEEFHILSFEFANADGRVKIVPDATGTRVEVTANPWGGRKGPIENKILNGIADDLAGREVQVDKHEQEKRHKAEEKRDRQRARQQAIAEASGPVAAPSAAIRGTLDSVKSALIQQLSSSGYAITGESEHQITVSRIGTPEQNLAWLASKVLVGNYTAQAYRANVQFIISSSGDAVNVHALAEVLVQNGYGAITRFDVTNNPQAANPIQQMLDVVKTRVENPNVAR
jgi:hypothetical protein